MQGEELQLVLKMRDEASRVLGKFQQELRKSGAVTKTMGAEMRQANQAFKDADQLLKRVGDSADDASGSLKNMAGQIGQMVGGAAAMYGLAAAARSTLQAFVTMEDGMSDVRKTSGLAGADLQAMSDDIDAIGRSVPVAQEKLYEFAATAGRAGVTGRKEIAEFTKTAAQMSVALDNINPDDLIAILNTTGEGAAGIKQFAAELNFLDDTSATSAAAILQVATDVSVVGAAFKMNSSDVLAFSTVVAEARQNGAAAATAFQRMGNSIRLAVAVGGKDLSTLAGIAGMTSSEFANLAKTDMAETLTRVLEGLKDIRSVDEVGYVGAMKALGVEAEEAQKPVTAILNKLDKLRESQAVVDNKPLTMGKFEQENQLQLERFSSQMILLKNNWQQLKSSIGADFAEAALPIVEGLADMVRGLNEVYSSLSEGGQKFVAFTAAGVAAVGALALTFGQLGLVVKAASALFGSFRLGALVSSLTTTAAAAWAAGGGFTGMIAAAAPLLGPIALVAALAGGLYYLVTAGDSASDAVGQFGVTVSEAEEYTENLRVTSTLAADSQSELAKAAGVAAGGFSVATNEADRLINKLFGLEAQAYRAANALAKARVAEAGEKVARIDSTLKALPPGAVVYNKWREKLERDKIAAQEEQQKAIGDSLLLGIELGDRKAAEAGRANRPPAPSAPRQTRSFAGPASEAKGKGSKAKASGGQTEAERELETRKKILETMKADAGEALAITAALNASRNQSNRALEEELSIIEATWELRRRTGDETAKLAPEEVSAVKAKAAALADVRDAEEAASLARDAKESIAENLKLVDIYGKSLEVQERLLFIHEREASLKRKLTTDELALANAEFDAAKKAEAAERVASMRRDAGSDKAYYADMTAAGFGDTKEAEVQRALADARRASKGTGISPEEVLIIREATEAQWDYNKALEDYGRQQQLADQAAELITDSFADLITGAKSLKEALKGVVDGLINMVLQAMILAPFKKMLGGIFGGLFADGGAFNSSGVQFYASGGVVSSPTMFGHSGGIGVMGEDGPEAILPLSRGSNGKLGVRSSGGGGQPIAITVNVAANGQTETSGSSDSGGRQLGGLVAAAVQSEIVKQQRPGGLLHGSRR